MATSTTVTDRRFEVISDERTLSAPELAALDVVSRPLAKCRGELTPGEYKVWVKLLISGGLTVRESVNACTPADVLGVLAWILARLPEKARSSVAAAIASGETMQTGPAERDAAKALCEPTRGSTVRSGAITGSLSVDLVR